MLDFSHLDLVSFCKTHSVTLSNVFQTAWGILLSAFVGSEDICFGYLTSGREIPVFGIEDAVGPFINMLICRMTLDKNMSSIDLLRTAQSDYLNSLTHQHCSLAEIQHSLDLAGGQPLFNTAITFIVQASQTERTQSNLNFYPVGGRNPTEVSLIL